MEARSAPDDSDADKNMAAEGGRVEQADAVADRAKAAGAVGPNGPGSIRALRDSAILARAACGVPASEIAGKFGLSSRTVRRILRQAARVRSPLDERSIQLVEDTLRVYLRQHADAQLLAWHYFERNPSATVGALRLGLDALDRYMTLLTAVGKLPTDLELFRNQAEIEQVARLMVRKLHEVIRSEATAQDALDFFLELLNPETELWGRDDGVH